MGIRYEDHTDPTRPLPMRKRILVGLGLSVAALPLLMLIEKRQTDSDRLPMPIVQDTRAPRPCGPEDVLEVELLEDAYDFSAGQHLCVHVDQVQTPAQAQAAERRAVGDG